MLKKERKRDNIIFGYFNKQRKAMTDVRYTEAFEKMYFIIESKHILDESLFFEIFDGKLRPIAYNALAGFGGLFNEADREDALQDVFLVLWKKCVVSYFLNDKYEKEPVMFLSWCKIVIKNYITTLARRKAHSATEDIDDPERPAVALGTFEEPGRSLINRETVKDVYSFVIGMKARIQIKLTWITVYSFIFLGHTKNRIEATHKYVDVFYGKKLFDIYSFLKAALEQTKWLSFTDGQRETLEDALDGGAGDTCLKDYLEEEDLSKISDWIYKVNKKIAEALPREVIGWNT